MKKLLILIGAIAAYGQTVSISDTLTNAVGGGSFTGRITVTLSAPGSAQPLYYSTTSLTGWQAVYCLGVTGSDCTTTTAAGVFAATLYANSTITPAGTSYSARFTPAKGSPWSETWVVGVGDTKLYQIRSTSTPTPTQLFSPSLISLTAGSLLYGSSNGTATSLTAGTNGHVLTLSGGYPAWSAVAACSTCVVTSGSYADPAWITSLAGSKVSGAVASATTATTATSATTATALAANPANCAAGTLPRGVDASGVGEGCSAVALASEVTGTLANANTTATNANTASAIVARDASGNFTAGTITAALTGNASTASALSSNLTSTRVLFGQGTGVPATSSYLSWTDQTSSYPTGVLTIGSGTQAFQIAGRGTDSGVLQGVPYLRSATANTPTAFDIMPSGNPAATPSGTVWMDLCSNDLQPLNSDSWNCAIMGISGYVFHSNNGSLVSYVDSGSTGTFTTLNPHQLSAGNSVVVSGGPTGLAGTYTIGSTPTSTTFTITSTGVADGTYTTSPSMVVSTTGSILIGAHNTSGTAGSTTNLAGTSIFFADKIGGTTRAQLTASKLGLGSTESIAWYFNTKSQRMASDFNVRWSSTSSPDGTEDVNISRYAANVLAVGTGAQGNASGTLRAATVIADLTGNASTATALASTVASGRLWIGQGTGVPTSDSVICADTTNHRLGVGTCSPGQTLTVVGGNTILPASPYSLYIGGVTDSAVDGMRFVNAGAASYLDIKGATGLILRSDNSTGSTERLRLVSGTGDLLIGTATDLGYGLHAANKGTNGNLLVFDPTATTGTTKAVVRAGAGQSGNLQEWQNNAGTALARILSDGSFLTAGSLTSGYSGSTGASVQISNSTTEIFNVAYLNGARVGLGSGTTLGWTASASAYAALDTSLSRSSAGVVQVGDGGANANGYLSAARLGVGTASPAQLLDVTSSGSTTINLETTTLNNSAIVLRRNGSTIGYMGNLSGVVGVFTGAGSAGVGVFNSTGNVAIGGTTDGNYKLDVQNSGSSGTLRVYDQTATTGNTKEVIRAGAGQSTNLTEWQNNAGTAIASVSSLGTIYSSQRLHTTGDVLLNNSGAVVLDTGGDGVLRLRDNSGTNFSRIQLGGTTSSFPSLKRSSAILQARLADDSAYTDIGVNAVIVNKAAPSASSDACTAGQLWAGDMGGTKYAFYCVASGTIVRSAFASF